MVEIYINDELLDLRGDESIEVDYSIFDITKIGSRGGARSYEFELPKTNRNKQILENPEMVNNLSALPYSRMNCLILVDGVDVLIRFAEIESVKDYYKLRVYGSNSDLFADIKDMVWEDLAVLLSEYDHFWNMDTVVDSRTRTEGYIYPIIDYHTDSPNAWMSNDNKTFRVEGLLPCFFYNTLLDVIFEYLGYTLVNEIGSDTQNVILAPGLPKERNHDKRRYNAVFQPNASIINGIQFQIPVGSLISTEGTFYKTGTYQEWDNYNPFIAFVDDVYLNVTGTFYVTNLDPADKILKMYVRYSSGGQTTAFTTPVEFTIPASATFYRIDLDYAMDDIIIQREGTGISDAPYIDFWADSNGQLAIEQDGFITIECLELYNQDYKIYSETNPNQFTQYEAHNQIIFDTDLVDNSHLFDYITASTMFPDNSPMDIVKNYMILFGVLPVVNVMTKTVTFKTFESITKTIGEAYDWDSIIDYTENHEISFLLNQYGQHKEFKYTEDGEEIKPNGSDGSIIIGDEEMRLDVEEITTDFGATNIVERLDGVNVCSIGWFKELEITETRLTRVLVNELFSSADIGGDVTYTDSVVGQNTIVATNIPIPYFIKGGDDSLLSLGFQTNILGTYYNYLSNILLRSKTVNQYIRLTPALINQLDFSRAVYLRHHESYFMINAIKGFSYTENRPTLVELVKLNING